MGSNGREIEKEQLDNYYAESTVFVAVGKNLKESESVLSWAIGKFAGKKRICILHIHQPGQLVTFFDGKFTTSKFKQRAIKVFHNSDMQQLQKLLSEYVHYVAQMGFRADRMWIEVENIENGIVSLIAQHGIKWLVMGAAADKHFTKEKAELKSQKAKFVYEQAPASCCIWFTCRGELILMRKGMRNHSGVDIFRATESQNTNSITEGMDDIRLGGAGAEDSSGPLGINQATEEAEYSEVESLAQDALSSIPDVSIEEEENLIVEAPAEDVLSSTSSVSTEESESESFESESDSESELESMTKEVEFDNSNNTHVDTPLLESNMVPEESRLVRTDRKDDEKGSPHRLTFRERGSILRAYSVDLSSVEEKSLVLSTSLDCSDRAKEDHGFEENSQMIEYRSSFSSVKSKDKMTGKAKLEAPREVYKKLNQATLDAEDIKHEAFRESVDRCKAEENAMDATRKADAIESKCIEEMKRREAVEEALAEHERECERMKEENEKIMEELPMVQDQYLGLANQIRESEAAAKELEEKIISAVDLLISFRAKRDQLEKERDDAIQELGKLKRLKQRRSVALSGLQFSTFSLLEIDEATCSFDPSKRIGDGRYGGVYRGILRHIDVSIRMLPNDGFLSQQMFERRVEILSRIRHPNIVKLIGFCPEVRSIAYEYLERGSLEDHLADTGKTHPLPWQTRVRIAAELCSALIFLHSNNPQILHGNLRPTKVLLDANFVGKIGDLGIFFLISRNQLPNNSQHASSEYIDPEFLETGVLTQYTDIYSFGMILLRILTGRPASRILRDVKLALKNDKLGSILDVSAGEWPISQAKAMARMALRCCVRDPSKRPDLVSDMWSLLEPFRKLSIAQPSCLQKKENKRPPSHFLCPIFKDIMEDPCTAADGYTYEGDAIRGWIDSGHVTSPMTNLKLSNCDLIPNHALQYAIQEWLQRP